MQQDRQSQRRHTVKTTAERMCLLLILIGCCLHCNAAAVPSRWTVVSPGSEVALTVTVNPLQYSVSFRSQEVIEPSPLGLELQDAHPFEALKLTSVRRRSADLVWTPVWGKSSPVRNRYNELTLFFREQAPNGRAIGLIVRAYPDGVAFRYVLPVQPNLTDFTLTRELTTFRFADNPEVWASSYANYRSSYEEEYTKRPLSALPAGGLVGSPLLAKVSEHTYAAILEADLTDWAGLYLQRDGNALEAALAPRLDGVGLVHARTPHLSPWRVLMLGTTAGALIESNLIANLSPPSRIKDTRWIRPGMMAWDHWWSGDVQMDLATNERFIQFASAMGFPYQLVDWQWYGPYNKADADLTAPVPALRMPELLRFAREHHVREWLWLHSGDVDRYLWQGRLDEVFGLYQRWGIAGVKIDFMNSDDQDRVNWYQRIVELAAKHQLMVDFHGAYKPTGLSVTWPNLLTREGVLGNEYNKFSTRVTPTHKLTLPFTRMLAGPMDYTPGGFLNRSPAEWKVTTPTQVMGSRAQELAMFVVYWSPLTCLADDPAHYERQPGLEFLRGLPTVWDETRVIEGEVGEHVVIARRHGQDWYLGGMSGNDAFRSSTPLGFLGAGTYQAHIFADPQDPTSSYERIDQSIRTVTSRDTLDLAMRVAGGVAIRFERLRGK